MRPLQTPLLSKNERLRQVSAGGQPVRERPVENADPDAVQRIQIALNQLGFTGADGKLLEEDGKYGANTVHAVRLFQKTVFTDPREYDGRIGPKTIDKLDDALAQQRRRPLMEPEPDLVFSFFVVDKNASDINQLDLPKILAKSGFHLHVLQVGSLADMVDHILARLQVGGTIGALTLTGHGRSGAQAVGGGKVITADTVLALNAAVLSAGGNPAAPNELAFGAAAKLGRLRGRFEPQARVRLLGCHVGAHPHGPQFLKKVSEALGNISVQAGSAEQNQPCDINGPKITCNSTFCFEQAPEKDPDKEAMGPAGSFFWSPRLNGRLV